MPEPDEESLESRVRNLEDEVRVSRSDAAAARVLAGGADREVSDVRSELRAHNQVLNALRETQLEQGQQIAELRSELRLEVGQLRSEMQQGFGTLHTGMAQITALLTTRDDGESG
ncbi:hypothetical protein GCM10009609_01580 [Pseudonocardia aurantiaca]|uniref:Uncharacterized protein n=1 Tax=Pseudonocardia aurantiaca TaxID=75290 RepID=A0ABW4FCX4_9PSEU